MGILTAELALLMGNGMAITPYLLFDESKDLLYNYIQSKILWDMTCENVSVKPDLELARKCVMGDFDSITKLFKGCVQDKTHYAIDTVGNGLSFSRLYYYKHGTHDPDLTDEGIKALKEQLGISGTIYLIYCDCKV